MDHLLLPIPEFDDHGNLPVGDMFGPTTTGIEGCVPCGLSAVYERFVKNVPHSNTRADIWSGWMRHRTEFEQFDVPYATIVNGSFTTERADPSDVDICVLFDAAALNALPTDAVEYIRLKLLCGADAKPSFSCDAYGIPMYAIVHPAFTLSFAFTNYWVRAFGHTRPPANRQKSFLLVSEPGVLS